MKNLLFLRIVPAMFFVSIALAGRSQQTPQTFVRETHYLLSLPEGYDKDTAKRWPLVIFLHGSGEAGTDIEIVKKHGPPKLVAEGKKFPFILVSPQAPPQSGWSDDNLYALLQHIKQAQRVDAQKIYLTGLSMGGYGTWKLAMEHPEEFAAIVPICGGGDTTDAHRLRNMPIWCFHGAKDEAVLPINSENLVKAVRAYNPLVRYTLYPDVGHNSWDLAYNNDSLYTWLLAQTKFSYKEVPISSSLLKQYEGSYVGDKDTLRIAIENNGLVVKVRNGRTIPLKASSENVFFVQPNVPVDVQFVKNKGGIDYLMVLEEKKRIYKKIK